MCALINVFLILLMVQSGLAYLRPIWCFICDSTTNRNCTDLRGLTDSNRALLADKMIHDPLYEECSYEKVNSTAVRRPFHEQKKSLLFELSEANNYRPPNEIEIPMVCQTVIGTIDKVRTTIRRCQYKNIESCDILKQKVRRHTADGVIYHCSVCEDNGCNGSSYNNGFGMLIGVLTAITTVFCHLTFSID